MTMNKTEYYRMRDDRIEMWEEKYNALMELAKTIADTEPLYYVGKWEADECAYCGRGKHAEDCEWVLIKHFVNDAEAESGK